MRRNFGFQREGMLLQLLSLHLYLQQLYDSGTAHNPDTVSLCSSHQTRPRMPTSVCLAALEVPSFVVGVCLLGMISWNALQNTQPAVQLQNYIFFCFRSAAHQYLSATCTKPALRRCILGRSNGNPAAALQAPPCDRHEPSFCLGVTPSCTNVLYCTALY